MRGTVGLFIVLLGCIIFLIGIMKLCKPSKFEKWCRNVQKKYGITTMEQVKMSDWCHYFLNKDSEKQKWWEKVLGETEP